MSVEAIAYFYVTYIEPGLKVFALFMLLMSIIYVLAFIKDPKRQLEIATQFFQFVNNLAIKTMVVTFHVLVWLFKFIWRAFHIVFATLRDFFMSRI